MSHTITQDEAELLDKMLQLMNRPNTFFTTDDFQKNISPSLEEWQVEHYLAILESRYPAIVKSDSSVYFQILPTGIKFLGDGGFKHLYKESLEEKKAEITRQQKQDQLLDLNIEELVNIVNDYPKSRSRSKWALFWAAIAALIAVLSWIYPRK